jgi:hypothetical protein
MKIKDHNALLSGYTSRFANAINEHEALKYPPLGMENDFIVYRSCVKEIGLLDTETA